ncbi:substrate-binding domain-containing protein [Zhaonella formicivorans]|uniref:substrate-binding domain-containing protein n=1 Tax=Zhaonella formicivorans TaxID=2528593 RepID=UPI0010DEF80B
MAGCARESQQPENKAAENQGMKEIILATTTSTVDSGLLDVLNPVFEEKTGYVVKTIPTGTGKALAMGERGDADVLLVHAPEAEKKLLEEGVVTNYRLVMHNDFVIVGPENDPAGISHAQTAMEAMQKIAASQSLFISRGDDSGTHKKELSLWQKANVKNEGGWYQESGTGMGETLAIANDKQGYTLSDRGTYLALKKNLKLKILFEGEKSLLNIYHVMQVNQEKFPKVNAEGARVYVEFMISPETQEMIKNFGVDKYGEPLFFPDAGKKDS